MTGSVGNSSIVAERTKILKCLEDNLKGHREKFLRAQQGYRKKAIELLDAELEKARRGEEFTCYIALQAPRDHSKDYERAILMLGMEVRETITVSEEQFACYVQDEWGWSSQWSTSNATYGVE